MRVNLCSLRCSLFYITQARILHTVCTAVCIAAQRQRLGGVFHRHSSRCSEENWWNWPCEEFQYPFERESHLVTVSSFWSLLNHPLLLHSLSEATCCEIVSVNHLFLAAFPQFLYYKMWSHLAEMSVPKCQFPIFFFTASLMVIRNRFYEQCFSI